MGERGANRGTNGRTDREKPTKKRTNEWTERPKCVERPRTSETKKRGKHIQRMCLGMRSSSGEHTNWPSHLFPLMNALWIFVTKAFISIILKRTNAKEAQQMGLDCVCGYRLWMCFPYELVRLTRFDYRSKWGDSQFGPAAHDRELISYRYTCTLKRQRTDSVPCKGLVAKKIPKSNHNSISR